MRIVAVANQKGGVGKTTTAINLATALAVIGRRVVVVDFDPQGNASTGLGLGRSERTPSSYDILWDAGQASAACRATAIPGLFVIPATEALAGAEVELVGEDGSTSRLRDALATLEGIDDVFIDCPPSLSLLTLNALVAADGVLVPLQTEYFALEGLTQLMGTIGQVQKRQNPKLRIEGVVLTMAGRNTLATDVANEARAALGKQVYETVIPRNVRLSEAPSHGLPAIIYDQRCPGSQAYLALAREIIAARAA